MTVCIDNLNAKMEAIKDCVEAALVDCNRPVCRSSLKPGAEEFIPWDNCCECSNGEGELWVGVNRVWPSDNFPFQVTGTERPCSFLAYAAELSIGVMRCSLALTDSGEAPTTERMEAEVAKMTADRAAVGQAIRCCYGPTVEKGEYLIGSWVPLGPNGGCVGGQQSLTITFLDCLCE